ncbi:MAG TPA: M15 family metallopeptidase [Patescibacteria group bacterium]|nr:M15 family metallopeptidase [Patescibacteria group bacterium]
MKINHVIPKFSDTSLVAVVECGEPLVKLNNSLFRIEPRKTDMAGLTGNDIYVRQSVRDRLVLAAGDLKRRFPCSRLLITYGYRSPEVQKKYYLARLGEVKKKFFKLSRAQQRELAHAMSAHPASAGHTCGAAVDLSIWDDRKKQEWDMGSPVAGFGRQAGTLCAAVSPAARRRRLVLLNIMARQGFAPFLAEWWHFSYGDKDWAFYYQKSNAIYGAIPAAVAKLAASPKPQEQEEPMTNPTYRTIYAAGGNPTGVVQLPDAGLRTEYSSIARKCMAKDPVIEQFGFLEGIAHFEMSGGEFCGNAARAAAWLIYRRTGRSRGVFTISGFIGQVRYNVLSANRVSCSFLGLTIPVRQVVMSSGLRGVLADMDGIVHVLLDQGAGFNADPAAYRAAHAAVRAELKLNDRPAVGVIWQQRKGRAVQIHPVVWVRDIDSFFYESACGSGTLAVLAASNRQRISVIQPSGQPIIAGKSGKGYTLLSEVSE